MSQAMDQDKKPGSRDDAACLVAADGRSCCWALPCCATSYRVNVGFASLQMNKAGRHRSQDLRPGRRHLLYSAYFILEVPKATSPCSASAPGPGSPASCLTWGRGGRRPSR